MNTRIPMSDDASVRQENETVTSPAQHWNPQSSPPSTIQSAPQGDIFVGFISGPVQMMPPTASRAPGQESLSSPYVQHGPAPAALNKEEHHDEGDIHWPTKIFLCQGCKNAYESLQGAKCEDDCEICRDLKAIDPAWIFSWIEELERWDKFSRNRAHGEHRHFAAFTADDQIWKVREKLGNLQLQMPAWRFLTKLAKHAEIHARELDRTEYEYDTKKLKKKCFSRKSNMQISIESLVVEHNHEKPDVAYRIRKKPVTRKSDGSMQDQKQNGHEDRRNVIQEKQKEFLTFYVAFHVRCMLEILYKHMDDFIRGDKRSSEGFSELARTLFTANDSKSEKEDIIPVGPVGERPLHVCSLLAAKFSGVLGSDNYMTDGILEGMMEFVWPSSPISAEAKLERWKEVYSPYGKDFCAAVGFLLDSKIPLRHAEKEKEMPCLRHIQTWKEQYDPAERSDKRWMVTVGLYEGETILHPRIASHDSATIVWLLNKEKSLRAGESKELATEVSKPEERLLEVHARGLFFQPMHREWHASHALIKGWQKYRFDKALDCNVHASSPKSYFGCSVLTFAASQGDTKIFDIILENIEEKVEALLDKMRIDNDLAGWPDTMQIKNFKRDYLPMLEKVLEKLQQSEIKNTSKLVQYYTKLKTSGRRQRKLFVRKLIVNGRDIFGNTLLHLAAWNDQQEMYSALISLGADQSAENNDGLTPFTLTARFGIWDMFNHIWKNCLTDVAWKFGNVIAEVVDYSQFDWKGLTLFRSATDLEKCMDLLIKVFLERDSKQKVLQLQGGMDKFLRESLNAKLEHWLDKEARKWIHNKPELRRILGTELSLTRGQSKWALRKRRVSSEDSSEDFDDDHEGHVEGHFMSAIRLITMFRPKGWYDKTYHRIENAILEKWRRGYFLVHLGNILLPYALLIAIFSFMWIHRELNIKDHSFWWSPNRVVASIKDTLESSCGWRAIRDSVSGRLQGVMIFYGVPSLLRLAYAQQRIRANDLDEDEDLVITFDELVNFIYFNLESLFHLITAGLFITIGGARIAAGDQCDTYYVHIEKDATAIAALMLFWNLFLLGKPSRAIGLLVLTTYRFLVKELFSFLVMYSIFFAAFLLCLQTLHNSDRVFLDWLNNDPSIIPQINAADNFTYLQNANVDPSYATQLWGAETGLSGCGDTDHALFDTAFALLEMSMGDGLGDALQQGRTFRFSCAGFVPSELIVLVLILWVFLTNILLLNLLIAMMSFLFDEQRESVNSTWLLDVSFRIFRYERKMPEIATWIQSRGQKHSMWKREYWVSTLDNLVLIFYSLPEVHASGFTHKFVKHVGERISDVILRTYLGERHNRWTDAVAEVERVLLKTALSSKSGHPSQVAIVFARSKKIIKFARDLISTKKGREELEERFKKDATAESKKDASAEITKDASAEMLLAILIYRMQVLKATHFDSFKTYSTRVVKEDEGMSKQGNK